MNCFLFTLFIIAAPLATTASYGSASYGSGSYGSASSGGSGASYLSSASSNGLDELVQAAAGGAQQAGGSITPANAEIPTSPAEVSRLSQVQAQLNALNSNAVYRNLKNSDAIAESLAQSSLASNIRQGNINIVAPNVVDQGVYRSLLVPSGQNNHQVIATQPLPPIIVNQPEQPPTHIGGGPAAVVKAAPVIYKIKPSVIYQQEVINKVPTPLSLNPVYVKVYKPGKKVDAPLVPGVQQTYQAPSYGGASYEPASAPSYGAAPAQSYGPAPAASYNVAPAPTYNAASSYGSEATYSSAPAPSYSSASAPAPGY
ncbi:PREDICTED: chorion protein S36 [Rhagoletis zephyria]|uniref:chorion protein S36 n=1 Tax=Rhagoletis zephyria TaxID=28612 RepID=UPI00081188EC|nr:PREDICTED: chorion protein S36 [Rhagoletis zephyria]